jgi:deazaflavin-dependent oxidoreductase (nitroreductase family)
MDLRNALMRAGTAAHAGLYRLTDGRVGATVGGARVLLLTTRGRRTGKPRTTPLMRVEHDGALHVVASAGGADTDPAWFSNLVAEPRVGVQDGADRFVARAAVLEGEERDRAYASAVAIMDGFAEYERATERTIPVVRLDRIAA